MRSHGLGTVIHTAVIVAIIPVLFTLRSAFGQCVPEKFQQVTGSDIRGGDGFGSSLAVSGSRLIVGAPTRDYVGTGTGSAYVFHIDQSRLWIQEAKLLALDGERGDGFGSSVDMMGTRAVVGATFDWHDIAYAGSAYVFCLSDGGTPGNPSDDAWVQEAKLVAADGALGQFGSAVAIDSDWIVVGSPLSREPEPRSGSIYLFRRLGNTTTCDPNTAQWVFHQRLTVATIGRYAYLGVSVAISGNRVVAGAYGYDGAYSREGTAIVFLLDDGGTPLDRADDIWALEQQLGADDAASSDFFGWSVAIEEETIVVGASGAGPNNTGALYVFRLDDNGTPTILDDDFWVQNSQLLPIDGEAYGNFGISVAFANDYIVGGAPYRNSNTGAVYAFHFSANGTPGDPSDDTWVQASRLTASDGGVQHELGRSVAVSENFVIAGAPQYPEEGTLSGAAYVFAAGPDCNRNGVRDADDILSGTSEDENSDGIPDECVPDCNSTGLPDSCDITAGTSLDCNANFVPDECDVAGGVSFDVLPQNGDGIPDECQTDCNGNGFPDSYDVTLGGSLDCTGNGIPDECELDCNLNLAADSCDLQDGVSADCNANGSPDECDIAVGISYDDLPPGGDGLPDECQSDCNMNQVVDWRDIENGVSADCDANNEPDECATALRSMSGVAVSSSTEFDIRRDLQGRLAGDGAGNWLVGWTSRDESEGTDVWLWDMFISHSADAGDHWSTPMQFLPAPEMVNTRNFLSDLVAAGDGRWLAVWNSTYDPAGQFGTDGDIFISQSVDAGVSWSIPLAVNSDAATDNRSDCCARVATDGQGNWIAVWFHGSNVDERWSWARSIDNGLSWSQPNEIEGRGRTPVVVFAGEQTWIIVWQTYSIDADIMFMRSDDAGLTWSPPDFLNSEFLTDIEDDRNPEVVGDGHGNWIVVWSRFLPDQSNTDIWFSRSVDDGLNWSTAAPVHVTGNLGDDRTPQVATDERGRWMVAWNSLDNFGQALGHDGDGVFSISEDIGISWSNPTPISTSASTLNSSWTYDIAFDKRATWFATWTQKDPDQSTPERDDTDLFVGRLYVPVESDCNCNGLPDDEDLAQDPTLDCDSNGLLDECEIREQGPSLDCDSNGLLDECEIVEQSSSVDCDSNGLLDVCEIDEQGSSLDCDSNGLLDDCEIASNGGLDLDDNGELDECQEGMAIPTLSSWGLLILTLLLFCGARVLNIRLAEYEAL